MDDKIKLIEDEVGNFFIKKMSEIIEKEENPDVQVEMETQLALLSIRALVCRLSRNDDCDKDEEVVVNVFTKLSEEIKKLNS